MPLLSSPTRTVESQYSAMTGLIYVFNVIVGTGALAIPHAVSAAGYGLSSIVLILLAFVSYITVTFVIESMAISNAIILTSASEEDKEGEDDAQDQESEESDPLISSSNQSQPHSQHSVNSEQILSRACFDISRTVEMGHMARLYFPKYGVILFYLTLVVYLYGDLAIYITVVSKSLRDVTCSTSSDRNTTDASQCLTILTPYLDRLGLYRLYCILFLLTIGPFSFLNVSRTKYLQMLTTLFRWTAFTTMIMLAIIKITGTPQGKPNVANPLQLPALFGVSIYSFMCHHSLPSLVTPIRSKKSIHLLFGLDYILISTFYILLSVTGVFAFSVVKDLYTLNFLEDGGLVNYLLTLFPVFTLSSNFPIISITLKNNLQTLFSYESNFSNICYTCLAILPPFLVSVFIQDVQFLVNFTGSFAGAGIQYVIPTILIYKARHRVGLNSHSINPYASPFRGDFWIWLVLSWCGVSVILVTVHMLWT